MRFAGVVRNDSLPKLLEDRLKRSWIGWWGGIKELSRRRGIQGAKRRLLPQRRQMFGDEVRDLATDALHRRVVEIERCRGRVGWGGVGGDRPFCHLALRGAFRLWLRLRRRFCDFLGFHRLYGFRRFRDGCRLGFLWWHCGLGDCRRWHLDDCGRRSRYCRRRSDRLQRRTRARCLEWRQWVFARAAALSRRLPFCHQLVECRFGLSEQTRMLRIAHGKGAFLLGSEKVFRSARSIGHGDRWWVIGDGW